MKLHQLQAMVGVVDHGGIRAAARELSLSQAAVTKSLRQLEEECGVSLLIRSSRGVGLTPDGERLLMRARLVVRQMELARDDFKQAQGGDEGVIRVAITPYATLTALGPALDWFRQRYKNVQLQVIDGLMARSLPRLRDGSLDLALVAADAGETSSQEFACTHVMTVPQRIAARVDHPILANPTAKAMVELEWIHTAPPVWRYRAASSAAKRCLLWPCCAMGMPLASSQNLCWCTPKPEASCRCQHVSCFPVNWRFCC